METIRRRQTLQPQALEVFDLWVLGPAAVRTQHWENEGALDVNNVASYEGEGGCFWL